MILRYPNWVSMIELLLTDNSKRVALSKLGKKIYEEQYSEENYTQKCLDIYQHILNFLVVSDTSMCQDKDNQYAFGPVVKELEALTAFKTIVWIGFNRGGIGQNKSLVQLKKGNIKLILLPSSGGHNVLHKAFVLLLYPLYCFVILKEVLSSKYIHVRAPSNPAVITMVLSWCFPTKKFWFKYAGNWVGEASWFYKCQRKLLKYLGANSKVTVNGNWENQSKHILAFENPCFKSNG